MNINDMTITTIDTITAFDISTGDYKFTLDELHDASISQSEDLSDITGKNGRKLSTLKRNKAVSITGTNGMISGGLLEMQTGGKFESKKTKVMWTDYLTIDASNSATTSYKAIGTTGAEIKSLYLRETNGSVGKSLTQAENATQEGTFAYAPASKKLTFNANDVKDNKEVIVCYERQIQASVLANDSGTLSGKAMLYIDAIAEDKCSNIYHAQFFIPKADFSGEFSLDMGDTQTVHAFNAQALAGACGNGSNFFTYTVFGDNTADAE